MDSSAGEGFVLLIFCRSCQCKELHVSLGAGRQLLLVTTVWRKGVHAIVRVADLRCGRLSLRKSWQWNGVS